MPVKLPPIEALIDHHAELIETHGGPQGLRDKGALEAALARPAKVSPYIGDILNVCDVAAILCFSICRIHHPFVDGNKRIAFAALGMTLLLNDFYLDANERDAENLITKLAAGDVSEEKFAEWVKANSFQLPEDFRLPGIR